MWWGYSKRFSKDSNPDGKCQKLHPSLQFSEESKGNTRNSGRWKAELKHKAKNIRVEKPVGDKTVLDWSHCYRAYILLKEHFSNNLWNKKTNGKGFCLVKWTKIITQATSDMNFYITPTKMNSSSFRKTTWQVMWKEEGGWVGVVSPGISSCSGVPWAWVNVCTTWMITYQWAMQWSQVSNLKVPHSKGQAGVGGLRLQH